MDLAAWGERTNNAYEAISPTLSAADAWVSRYIASDWLDPALPDGTLTVIFTLVALLCLLVGMTVVDMLATLYNRFTLRYHPACMVNRPQYKAWHAAQEVCLGQAVAMPRMPITSAVALSGGSRRQRLKHWRAIVPLYADVVICDRKEARAQALIIITLDGAGRRHQRRIRKIDKVCKRAGLRFINFSEAQSIDLTHVANTLKHEGILSAPAKDATENQTTTDASTTVVEGEPQARSAPADPH